MNAVFSKKNTVKIELEKGAFRTLLAIIGFASDQVSDDFELQRGLVSLFATVVQEAGYDPAELYDAEDTTSVIVGAVSKKILSNLVQYESARELLEEFDEYQQVKDSL